MLCFSMICVSAGSKSRLAKAEGAEVAAQSRQEKWHAAVARSTFASQNAKNMTCSGHFWTFRSPKMARRCGAKRIYKTKCKKTPAFCTTFRGCTVQVN